MFRNLKLIMAVIATFFISSVAMAQTAVRGIVADDSGAPLLGATITETGTSNATKTNASGVFNLVMKGKGESVLVTYTGMSPKTVTVSGADLGTINLAPKSRAINDIVVVGYGSTRQKDVTGAINSVKAKDFQNGVVQTAEQLIVGKTPGIQITQNSGEPGVGSRIRIRGGSSISAVQDPLYVIDGMIIDHQKDVLGSANPLNLINPNDIESIDVLKDAASTAIYGNRGSNGVIIITTKKGSRKADRLNVTFTSNNSLSTPTGRQADVLNAREYRELVRLTQDSSVQALLGNDSTDWFKAVTRNALGTDNTIAFTGGIKGLPYRLSIGRLGQQGIVNTSSLERYTVGLNLSPTFFNNTLKVNVNTKASRTGDNYIDVGQTIGSALAFDPTQSIYAGSPDALWGGYTEWLDNSGNPNVNAPKNPVGRIMQRENNRNVNRFLGNVQLDYRLPFLKNVRANLNLGTDYIQSDSRLYIPATAASDWSTLNAGRYKNEAEKRSTNLMEAYLNYNKSFGGKHNVDALVGHSYQNNYQFTPSFATYGKDGVKEPANANPFETRNVQLSNFGRVNYNYRSKYYLMGSLRNDLTSRFAPAVRSGWFPAVSGAWKINAEDFMKDNKTVSNLKLRAGWGRTGQQNLNISDYYYFSKYNLGNNAASYQLGNDFYQTWRDQGANPNLTWEVVESSNLGLDFGVFKNRINGSVDVYNRVSKDLMVLVDVPAASAATNRLLQNVGELYNRGVEVGVNFVPVASKNLTWDINMNYTYNVNKVVNINNSGVDSLSFITTGDIAGIGNKIQIFKPGQSLNTFFTYQQVYGTDGKPLEGVYKDQNSDGVINQNDLVANHSSEPRNMFGFSTNLNFKKFGFGLLARAQTAYVYNNIASNYGALSQLYNGNPYLQNIHGSFYDTRFKTQQFLSDYYVENASFFRLDNVYASYNLGSISRTNSGANLKITGSVQNVFVITNYSGVDPEIANGIDNTIYPRPRVFNIGFNLDF